MTVSTHPLISKSSSPFINHDWYYCHFHVPKFLLLFFVVVVVCFFFLFPRKVEVFIILLTFFQFYSVVSWDGKVHNFANSLFSFYLFFFFFFFFFLIIIRFGRLGDPFVCLNPRGVCVRHSPGQMLGCTYTICSYGQISISCTIPSGSLFPSSRA